MVIFFVMDLIVEALFAKLLAPIIHYTLWSGPQYQSPQETKDTAPFLFFSILFLYYYNYFFGKHINLFMVHARSELLLRIRSFFQVKAADLKDHLPHF